MVDEMQLDRDLIASVMPSRALAVVVSSLSGACATERQEEEHYVYNVWL